MLNHENLEMLQYWLSEEGRHLLELADSHNLHLGQQLLSYPILESYELLPYLEDKSVSPHLQELCSSQPLQVLNLGCGDGWEAFGLAFLLHPAKVLGIGYDNDEETIQHWESRSGYVGAFEELLPDLLNRINNLFLHISDPSLIASFTQLRDTMHNVTNKFLTFVQHDIQNASWPLDIPSFDLVFSKSSFYHTQDRMAAMTNIRDALAEGGIWLLHEPSTMVDGKAGLTPEWFDQMAVQQLGFSSIEVLQPGTDAQFTRLLISK